MIVLVDYGAGNIASVKSALCRLSYDFRLISKASEFPNDCTSIILPGVGDGSYMMKELKDRAFDVLLKEWAQNKPLLGICVGAQVLLDITEEGNASCLQIISGACKSMKSHVHNDIKIPHMGWNGVRQHDTSHPLFDSIPDNANFYFVHSYYLSTETEFCLATTDYHFEFASIIAKKKVIGLQFHPEKSGKWGLQMIDNYLSHIAEEKKVQHVK